MSMVGRRGHSFHSTFQWAFKAAPFGKLHLIPEDEAVSYLAHTTLCSAPLDVTDQLNRVGQRQTYLEKAGAVDSFALHLFVFLCQSEKGMLTNQTEINELANSPGKVERNVAST